MRKTWGKTFFSVCYVIFLLVFFFFFRRLSTILLIRHFTYAKIFVRNEYFLIVSFVTFSLANILNISCWFPGPNERFEAKLSCHWRQFSNVEILSKQILFIECTSVTVRFHLMTNISFVIVSLDILSENFFRWIFGDWHERYSKSRNSHSLVFYKIVVFKNFAPVLESLFNSVQVFSCEFHEIIKNIYFTEYLRRNDSESICIICWNFITKVFNFS